MLLRTLHTIQSIAHFGAFTIADAAAWQDVIDELEWLLGPQYVLLAKPDFEHMGIGVRTVAADPVMMMARPEKPLAVLFTARAAEAVMEKIQTAWAAELAGEAPDGGSFSRIVDIRDEMLEARPKLADALRELQMAEDAAAGRSRSIDLSGSPTDPPAPSAAPAEPAEPLDERTARLAEDLRAVADFLRHSQERQDREAEQQPPPTNMTTLAQMLRGRGARLEGEPFRGNLRTAMQQNPDTGRRVR